MAFDGPVVITLDEYSFISDGRKVTIPKGEVLLVISRPNERWSLVTRSAGSLKFFIPTRILENISKDVTGRGTATYCIPPVDLPSEIFEDQVYHHSTQMSCHLDNPSTPETPVSNDERRISDCDQATCRSPSNADVSSEADHPNLRVVESQTKGLNVSTQPSNIPDSVAGSTDKVSWRRLRDGDQELYVNQLTAEMWAPAVDAHGRTYYYEVNSRNSVWELENLNDCEDGDEPSHHTVYDAVYSGTDKEDDKLDESGRLLPSSNTPAVASSVDRPRPKVRNSPRLNVTTIHCLFSDASKSSQSFDSVSPTDVDAPASDDPEGSGRFALARIGKEHISGPLENKLVNFERRCMVRRTKYIENDRRLPKRWSDALLLLSGPWLLFYKDAKSALPKANAPYGKPEIKLHVQLVEVSDASGLETSRENVLKIEQTDARGLKDAYLVQLTANVMDSWKAAIRYAKQILDDDDRLTPSLARNTLKYLPNPPSKLDTGLLAKMREFFRSRPSAELLRSRGILKNEPVFASSLVQICENENSEVPRFVVCAVRAIEARGLHHLGIYRISANAATVQKLRCRVNQSDNYSLNSDMWTLDVITGALKLFFRELKEPLFTFDTYPKIVKLFTSNKSDDELLGPMHELIQSMPNPHIATARVLFHHLCRVLEYSELNQMHSHKLAIIFGLSLVRSENDCDHLGTLTSVQAPCVDFCLQHTVELFGPLIPPPVVV